MNRYGTLIDNLPNDSRAVVEVDEMKFDGTHWQRTDKTFNVSAARFENEDGSIQQFTIPKGAFIACREIHAASGLCLPLSWSDQTVDGGAK